MALRKTRKEVTMPKPAPGPTYAESGAERSRRKSIKRGNRLLPVSRAFEVISGLLSATVELTASSIYRNITNLFIFQFLL
jgi:hypothetical protein